MSVTEVVKSTKIIIDSKDMTCWLIIVILLFWGDIRGSIFMLIRQSSV